jgi:hypothetical protein
VPDARALLTQQVANHQAVSRVDVTRAKKFIMTSRGSSLEVGELLRLWTLENGVPEPELVRSGDAESMRSTGRFLSLRLAAMYAVHELLVSAALLPGGGAFSADLHVPYQHGNERGGLHFGNGV